MHCTVILVIVLPSFLLSLAETKSGVRKKRILYGHEARNKNLDAYDIFRYYVYLQKSPVGEIDEDASTVSGWIAKFFNSRGPAPKLEDFHCGGALVTPYIVETACHCLAVFNQRSQTDNYTYPWPLNVWEDRIYSYLGANSIVKMYDFLDPKRYVISQRCRVLEFNLDFPMMDFGFIYTKESVDKKTPKASISYAPAYSARDILDFYYEANSKEYMCLLVGHGSYQVDMRQDDQGTFHAVVKEEPSELQRWGWRNLMNYVDCLSASYSPLRRKQRKKSKDPFVFFNYTSDSTQVCFKAFTDKNKYHYNFGSGDSGGPVSCNGVLFAVSSMSEYASPNILSYGTPVVHSLFINAADYREDLIWWVLQYFDFFDAHGLQEPDIPYPIPTYPPYWPTPPPIDVRPLSNSPPHVQTFHLHFLLLSSILLNTLF